MRKRNNNGFTLVELIVVLVILAILAAMLIPALTGYIDRAQEDKIKTLTRQVVVAAQTVVSEAYGKSDGDFDKGSIMINQFSGNIDIDQGRNPHKNISADEIVDILILSEVVPSNFVYNETTGTTNTGFSGEVSQIIIIWTDKGKVNKVLLGTNNRMCTYVDTTGEYTVTKY